MANIQVFTNQEFTVRSITDENGTVWFVAKDIAEALEYSESTISNNMSNLFSSVPSCWADNKRIIVRSENGVEQARDMLCLTEQGVYFFLGRSDKPKALPYQMWIAGEVVPSIRETGSYNTKASSEVNPLEGAKFIYELAGISGNQLVLAVDKVYKRYTGFSALEASGIELTAPTKHQLLTPTEIGKHFGLSARRINELLAGAGYQYNIEGRWEPLELGQPYAVMQDTGKRHSDGTPIRQLKWESEIIRAVEEIMREVEEYPFAV